MKNVISLFSFIVILLCSSCTKTETNMFGRIHGIITDSGTGEPIQTASVTLTPGGMTTITGSDGRYDYGDLSAGEYTVQISKTGYQTNTKRVNVEPGYITPGDVLLSPETEKYGGIRGLIKDAETGEPLPMASVSIMPGNQSVSTGNDGYYTFGNLEPGTYTIQVTKAEYQTNSRNIDVTAGTVSSGDIPMYYGSGTLKVSMQNIEFGTSDNLKVFSITNNGKNNLNWAIDANCEWISEISPRSGTLASSKSASVTVKVDRAKVPDDKKHSYTVVITSDGGSAEITVSINGSELSEGSGGLVVTNGLLVYYTFDDETANDLTDNEINANLVNTPDFINDTPNKSGKALYLNATKGQYLATTTNPIQNLTEISFSFWVKDLGGAGQIMSGINPVKGYSSRSYPYLYISSGVLGLRYSSATSSYVSFNYDTNGILDEKWHLLTYSIGGGKVVMYVDAKKIAEASGSYVKSGCPEIFFGGTGNVSGRTAMDMKLDNIRIYSRALTQDDVNKIYAAEKE